jgi:osmotically-inducible protein OsmY
VGTYGYPQKAGMPNSGTSTGGRGGSSSGSFGQTLYSGTTTNTSNSMASATVSSAKVPSNYNTFGMKRDLPYTTVMGPSMGGTAAQFRANNTQVSTSLQSVVAQSSRLSANRNINVTMDGNTVVLKGFVDTPRDSRIAEGLARVTPGVRDVRNELQVKNPDGF